MLILPKRASTPATPATDKIAIYCNSGEIPGFINDAGTTYSLPPWSSSTWTPGVSFGGGTTGITYSAQVGRYDRIGNRVHISGYLRLSNKGSSTGTALVTGLPFASVNLANYFQALALFGDDLASITGHLQGYIAANGSTVNLAQLGTGTSAVLTHSNFNNTALLMIAGSYEVPT